MRKSKSRPSIIPPILKRSLLILLCLAIAAFSSLLAQGSVDFPGPHPGNTVASIVKNVYRLSNSVISQSWRTSNGHLEALDLTNRLTGRTFDQSGAELFRLSLNPSVPVVGVFVGIRLESNRVVAVGSKDGFSWSELASFPRKDFSGTPALIRIGKMSLKAQSKDNPGDLGPMGHSKISQFSLGVGSQVPPSVELTANAHQGKVLEFAFPTNQTFIHCRIDKDTDQGMSWGTALAFIWQDGKKFLLIGVRDKAPTFNVTTQDGERILGGNLPDPVTFDLASSRFHLIGEPRFSALRAKPSGIRLADRIAGMALQATLATTDGIKAEWTAELRTGSNYIHQSIKFSTIGHTLPIFGVELQEMKVPQAQTVGVVPGCPATAQGLFFGAEMPGAQNRLSDLVARTSFGCKLNLEPGQSYSFGSVVGVAAAGQLRRSFLYYLERERARPSSPFLHYNCWYDLGYTVDADKIVDAATTFDRELVKKRGVAVKSYLVDDGWDDPSTGLWKEDASKFPGGFKALRKRMEALHANLAIWISPLGGYGGDSERTADAQKLGLIPADAKLDLSYPRYKKWFQDRCLELMREGGVNAFKWDRAGDGVSPHFMALLDIAKTLRQQDKDVFINVTVGTWPSPFWLNHVDSTWRNGSADVGWTGQGDLRNQWLTFRDGYCKRMFVDRSPLYPLNSVMHHGIVNGRYFQGEPLGKTGPHLKEEARSYFANGTSLQELYLTPSLMTTEAWDDVAEAAKWAKQNADVLADSHWFGGDPLKSEIYGYAAWNRRKGTLMLRNPSDKPQAVTFDIGDAFELPNSAPRHYTLASPYKDQRIQVIRARAKVVTTLTLSPFEVLVFDANPVNK